MSTISSEASPGAPLRPSAAAANSTWRGRVRRALGAGLDLFFPPACACCARPLDGESEGLPAARDAARQMAAPPERGGSFAGRLCAACRGTVAADLGWQCARCAAQRDAARHEPNCGHCLQARWRFERVVALGPYRGLLREMILRMKHGGHDGLSWAVADFFFERRGEALAALGADLVVPIPLYWTRRIWRGTNSSQRMAEALAARLALPHFPGVLHRRRNTRPQWTLSPRQRVANVRRALAVGRGCDLGGLHVLLVDDVLTSGATCDAAARALRRAGAARVSVAVAARAA